MIRLYALLAGLMMTIILLAGGYYYFRYSQGKIEALTQQVEAVQQRASALDASNRALQDNMEAYKKLTLDANERLNAIEQQAQRTAAILAKHDLQNLASKKPKLVEDAINKSSNAFWSGIEATTR